jgi:hypothetical protein
MLASVWALRSCSGEIGYNCSLAANRVTLRMGLILVKNCEEQELPQFFQERASRASRAETVRILARAGQENPPVEGDELPPDWKRETKVASRKSVEIKKRSRKK